jgi:hypothetical protein
MLGGTSESRCVNCADVLRRIVLLDPVPADVGVTSRRRIDIAYCQRCVGAQPSQHRHDAEGQPMALTAPEENPIPFEFGEPRPAVEVGFRRAGDRWRLQDWGQANGRENLNRLGGEFTWIQNPEHPRCLVCGRVMKALLQLDWDHLSDGEGMTYVLWCDRCSVSALTYQQT